jgi:hypothetical protein
MGLDLVEFVMEVEEAFQLRIPDADWPGITTPRQLINYLAARWPAAAPECRSQRTFHLLRRAIVERVGCPRSALRLDTSLLRLIRKENRADLWDAVRRDVGVERLGAWPRLADPGWLDPGRRRRVGTLREVVRFLVPGIDKRPRPGWTRPEVAAVIDRLMRGRFGVGLNRHTEDKTWQEMGID